ncbi:MAG TPA: flap structure-specific endonuclease [Thermoplasmata archaeon]|nr:flap structure-specific endonuclease [Thermoplasmata archaeon]
MGLPFRDLVRSTACSWEELSGRSLAVDGYNAIYQFLATIRQRDGQPFSDPEGRTTSHLMGVFYRTTNLLANGVRPVWVFDGRPPDLKAGTLRARYVAKERAETAWQEALAAGDLETARRKAAQTSRLTRPMVEEVTELLRALGVPTVQAPSEGEAQAAAMAAAGVVWAAASEDYDSLLFGAPRLVRGLAARGSGGGAPAAQVIERDRVLADLGVSGDELLAIALLVGTDFNDGATGIGPKRALKLAQQHLGYEATLRAGGLDPDALTPVAEIFRHPEVAPTGPVAFGRIDPVAVERILVDGHGFSADRVHASVQRATRSGAQPAPLPSSRARQAVLDGFAEEDRP